MEPLAVGMVRMGDCRVLWSEEDQEWVAFRAWRPSLVWMAADPVEALTGLIKVLEAE